MEELRDYYAGFPNREYTVEPQRGQEIALAVMEERIDTISAIADRNLQNAGETHWLQPQSLFRQLRRGPPLRRR